MERILDNLLVSINRTFSEFILAFSCIKEGLDLISKNDISKTVSLQLDKNIITEPKSYEELLKNRISVKSNVSAHYQNIIIANWFDAIHELFTYFLDEHFSKNRKFVELKKRSVKIDFSSDVPFEIQARNVLQRDFSFLNYNDKIKLINHILYQENSLLLQNLDLIKKHVLIRNSIQHHASKAYKDMFSQLGISIIEMLDTNGGSQNIAIGETIIISPPELDRLKRAIYQVIQSWRNRRD